MRLDYTLCLNDITSTFSDSNFTKQMISKRPRGRARGTAPLPLRFLHGSAAERREPRAGPWMRFDSAAAKLRLNQNKKEKLFLKKIKNESPKSLRSCENDSSVSSATMRVSSGRRVHESVLFYRLLFPFSQKGKCSGAPFRHGRHNEP